MTTITRVCENEGCNTTFKANKSDIKRGWGRFCSKRCSASFRLKARHAANRALRELHDVKTTEDDIELVQNVP